MHARRVPVNVLQISFAQTLESLRESHRLELSRAEDAQKQKEAELNAEMKRHRERTIALLSEKVRFNTQMNQPWYLFYKYNIIFLI